MKKILLHPDLKKQIAKELKVTTQSVDMSLKYVFDSDKAKSIRKRAKELLENEVKNIVI
jgi:hypothetical protein